MVDGVAIETTSEASNHIHNRSLIIQLANCALELPVRPHGCGHATATPQCPNWQVICQSLHSSFYVTCSTKKNTAKTRAKRLGTGLELALLNTITVSSNRALACDVTTI